MTTFEQAVREIMEALNKLPPEVRPVALTVAATYLAGDAASNADAVTIYDSVIDTLLEARLTNLRLYEQFFKERGNE